MRLNVRVKGDNVESIREALKSANGISEFSELPLTNESAIELRQLETDHTELASAYAKLQQQAASMLMQNKQMRGAMERFDALVTYLTRCVAGLPTEPAIANTALNVLCRTLVTSQDHAAKCEAVIGLLKKQAVKVTDAAARVKAAEPTDNA